MSPMTWILYIYTIYATTGVGRRGVKGGLGTSLHFEIWHFPINFFCKEGCFLSFGWKKWNLTIFVPPYENPWLYLEKSTIAPSWIKFSDAHVHVWLIMDNWWTIVLWSGSTKGWCNSLGSVSSLVNLHWSISLAYTSKAWLPKKYLVQLSELWGQLPPPWLRAWVKHRYFYKIHLLRLQVICHWTFAC